MQQTIAFFCLLGAEGMVAYVVIVAYFGWEALLVPLGLTVAVLMAIHNDRKKHGPM